MTISFIRIRQDQIIPLAQGKIHLNLRCLEVARYQTRPDKDGHSSLHGNKGRHMYRNVSRGVHTLPFRVLVTLYRNRNTHPPCSYYASGTVHVVEDLVSQRKFQLCGDDGELGVRRFRIGSAVAR